MSATCCPARGRTDAPRCACMLATKQPCSHAYMHMRHTHTPCATPTRPAPPSSDDHEGVYVHSGSSATAVVALGLQARSWPLLHPDPALAHSLQQAKAVRGGREEILRGGGRGAGGIAMIHSVVPGSLTDAPHLELCACTRTRPPCACWAELPLEDLTHPSHGPAHHGHPPGYVTHP